MPPNNPNGFPAPQAQHHNPSKLPLILMIVFIVLFLMAAGFGFWAFGGRQDYKNNTDQKIADAVAIAKKQTATQKDTEFVEKYKEPYNIYDSPDTFGSVHILYPRTWSAYINEKGANNTPIDGYLHPGFVPGVESGTAFALHVEVVNQTYEQQVKQFDSKAKTGKIKISPYKAKQVPGILGSRVEGEINIGQKDYMVLFPIRDKTVKISTQSDKFVGDFDNIILANLKFTP